MTQGDGVQSRYMSSLDPLGEDSPDLGFERLEPSSASYYLGGWHLIRHRPNLHSPQHDIRHSPEGVRWKAVPTSSQS